MANFAFGNPSETAFPAPAPRTTLADVVARVSRRLGDSAQEIWDKDELETYAQQGYEQFVSATGALWDSRHLPDKHLPAYTTDVGAQLNAESQRVWNVALQPQASASVLINGAVSKQDIVIISDPTPFLGDNRQETNLDGLVSLISSPADVPNTLTAPPQDTLLPDDIQTVERATWDGIRMRALTPMEADRIDDLWEDKSGDPRAFVVVGKGRRKLFKRLRSPSAPADTRAYSNEVGFLHGAFHEPDIVVSVAIAPSRITLTPFSIFNTLGIPTSRVSTFYPYPILPLVVVTTYTNRPSYGWTALRETSNYSVIGARGIPKRIDGMWFTNGPWGFAKRFNCGARNTRIDYVKKASLVNGSAFELQDWDIRYIVFFMLSRSLSREGPGQNSKLAEHYKQRYDYGVKQVKLRNANMNEAAQHIMGTGTVDLNTETIKLPSNYDSSGR